MIPDKAASESEAPFVFPWLSVVSDVLDVQSWRWFWAMHFAMATMTTVGYGDITPTNTAEVVYTLFPGVRRAGRY